jgi:16S rRNA (uracil1498-N3)-methyltransferase
MSDRFFINSQLSGDVFLEGSEAHHLIHVRRFQIGDRVTLFNGDGKSYQAQITSIHKKQVRLTIESIEEPVTELAFRLVVASALPKGDRFDFLLEKLTEIGVTDFIPLQTTHSVVIPKSEKIDKWQRAVIEASKQCGRNRLMQIHLPMDFQKLLQQADWPTLRILADPSGVEFKTLSRMGSDVLIAIGPEGGFSPQEIESAKANQWQLVQLGPRILRIETAGVALAGWFALNSI